MVNLHNFRSTSTLPPQLPLCHKGNWCELVEVLTSCGLCVIPNVVFQHHSFSSVKILNFKVVKYKQGLKLDHITMIMGFIVQQDDIVWTIKITLSGVAGVGTAGKAGTLQYSIFFQHSWTTVIIQKCSRRSQGQLIQDMESFSTVLLR